MTRLRAHCYVSAGFRPMLPGENKMRISARNLLKGTVKEVHKGATTAHVVIELEGGQIIFSSITNEAVEQLGLAEGVEAFAVIKASDVMIAVR
jgi:molybdopterin-binding protein